MSNSQQPNLAPATYRFGKALPWLIAGFGTIGVMVWLLSLEGTLTTNWLYFAFPLIPAAIGVRILIRPLELPAATKEPLLLQSSDAVDPKDPDILFDAKWWIRYPISLVFFYGAYYCAFEWGRSSGWLFAMLLLIGGFGLVRELFVALLLSLIAGAILWAIGAAFAALPVSAAIIIGAMIIAQAVRR